MSRSIKATPVIGMTTKESEKSDKQHAHRALRAHFRASSATAELLSTSLFDERNIAHSNAHTFAKDGRQHLGGAVVRNSRVARYAPPAESKVAAQPAHKLLSK